MLPVVPMFHANAWGYPYTCALVGAKLVFPGPHLDPSSLLEDLEQERVTVTAGVPTIWMGILRHARRGARSVRPLSAARDAGGRLSRPARDDRGVQATARPPGRAGVGHDRDLPSRDRLGLVGSVRDAGEEALIDIVAMQGLPLPFVELRARDDTGGTVAWDGETMGELEVRGPWVAAAYYDTPEQADRWTQDGWFRTGDIVCVDPRGYIKIQDRAKDVIKSGGEWISSVELENALMAHPAVAEAAVIAVPDEKWDERPLAVVVLREGAAASPEELREFLAPQFVRWWLPDRVEFVTEIPKTAVGKFRKTALREMFATPVSP